MDLTRRGFFKRMAVAAGATAAATVITPEKPMTVRRLDKWPSAQWQKLHLEQVINPPVWEDGSIIKSSLPSKEWVKLYNA